VECRELMMTPNTRRTLHRIPLQISAIPFARTSP
jgi:hypothetical protein